MSGCQWAGKVTCLFVNGPQSVNIPRNGTSADDVDIPCFAIPCRTWLNVNLGPKNEQLNRLSRITGTVEQRGICKDKQLFLTTAGLGAVHCQA